MLKNVEIDNFKSWQKLDLNLAPITGLFGRNGSGKSSLLQFLLMLKQTKERVDRSLILDFGSDAAYANLGSFRDVIFGHHEDLEIGWRLNWSLPERRDIRDPTDPRKVLFSGDEMSIAVTTGQNNTRLETRRLAYEFCGQTFSLAKSDGATSDYRLETIGSNNFKPISNPGPPRPMPGPIKSYAFPDQAQTCFQNTGLLSEFEIGYEKLIDSIYHLGPLRESPRREYMWSGARPVDVGQRGERVVDALLAAKADNEQRQRKKRGTRKAFDQLIAEWLRIMKLVDRFSVREIAAHANIYKMEVRKTRSAPEVLITDVGFGVSQVLPVLVLLYYVPEKSIVLLEQPEIHLHPAVQSDLADLIINAVQTRDIQVVVESHSEHLLRRLQRRVAEKTVPSEDIALFFCNSERGRSHKTDLKINSFGHLDNWPEYFFGDEFGEIVAIEEAGLEQRMAEAS